VEARNGPPLGGGTVSVLLPIEVEPAEPGEVELESGSGI
jgi:hypothetical protein